MELNEAVAKRLHEILQEKQMTQYALSKVSGVPQSTISTILKANSKTVKLSTISDICSGLQIEVREFFNKDYFNIENLYD